MGFTVLTFDFESLLTSTKMTQLKDNTEHIFVRLTGGAAEASSLATAHTHTGIASLDGAQIPTAGIEAGAVTNTLLDVSYRSTYASSAQYLTSYDTTVTASHQLTTTAVVSGDYYHCKLLVATRFVWDDNMGSAVTSAACPGIVALSGGYITASGSYTTETTTAQVPTNYVMLLPTLFVMGVSSATTLFGNTDGGFAWGMSICHEGGHLFLNFSFTAVAEDECQWNYEILVQGDGYQLT